VGRNKAVELLNTDISFSQNPPLDLPPHAGGELRFAGIFEYPLFLSSLERKPERR